MYSRSVWDDEVRGWNDNVINVSRGLTEEEEEGEEENPNLASEESPKKGSRKSLKLKLQKRKAKEVPSWRSEQDEDPNSQILAINNASTQEQSSATAKRQRFSTSSLKTLVHPSENQSLCDDLAREESRPMLKTHLNIPIFSQEFINFHDGQVSTLNRLTKANQATEEHIQKLSDVLRDLRKQLSVLKEEQETRRSMGLSVTKNGNSKADPFRHVLLPVFQAVELELKIWTPSSKRVTMETLDEYLDVIKNTLAHQRSNSQQTLDSPASVIRRILTCVTCLL